MKLPRPRSREARDTLFLLATIAAVVLPHAEHLPAAAMAITALVLGWRALLAWQGRALPGRGWLALIAIASAAVTWLMFRSLVPREAGIMLLVLLMALKTLELRARRDAFVVFFLGFFLVLTQFLFSQSLATALWMLGATWALLTSLVLAQMPVGQPSLAVAARQALRSTLMGLPLMVALFVLFPRIAPLWGVPAESLGHTGLSMELNFGQMSEIANDDGIAMRLRFDGAPPPRSALYFRGPVLERFDGRTWLPARAADSIVTRDAVQVGGTPLHYVMTLEPLRIQVLPLLETAPGSSIDADGMALQRGPAAEWQAARPLTEHLRFAALAYPQRVIGAERSAASLAGDLALPPGSNPRLRAWAAQLRADPRIASLDPATLPVALAQAVLQHFASGGYLYTLSPGSYGDDTPDVIDEFWFDRRLGFCEHFASAFVFAMRAMGVPARIVTGFQGMDDKPEDGWWIVRNSNAHAWAEYWAPGLGWLRTDPTAVVAPQRIAQGLALEPTPSAMAQLNPKLWRSLRVLRGAWERLDNDWQQWVLNYSRRDQFDLLKHLGVEQPDWQALGRLIAGVIFAVAVVGIARSRWLERPHDAWTRQRTRLRRELARLGVQVAAHETPLRWAAALSARHGERAAGLAALLQSLERSRYAPEATPPDWAARRRWWRDWARAARMLRA
ncbi:MAG: DUF3488 domain-containing transglutaminase family protein [Paucibacter sp.]|nr:DUF3488 domain-containing transglutaminase family protein [Roseateles sp.]